MERKEKFIKGALRRNAEFKDDLQRLLDLDVSVWPEVKRAGMDAVQGLLYGDKLKSAAAALQMSEVDTQRMAVMYRFLTGKLADGGEAIDLVEEIVDIAERSDAGAEFKTSLAAVLAVEPKLLAEERERDAFTFGSSIASIETKSLVSFHADGEPYAGVSLTLNYLDGGNNNKSVSLNMSAGEIRATANSLLHAAEKAEKDLSAIRGTGV